MLSATEIPPVSVGMKDSSDFAPLFAPDCFGPDGRLVRLFKGGSTAARQASEEQANAQLEQQKKQHEENMRQLRAQARVAADAKAPSFTPAAPPSSASVDTLQAAVDQQRKAARRFGFNRTADSSTLGTLSTLGASA